jgi:glycosyltransferase involved in cell wall biosynthesis
VKQVSRGFDAMREQFRPWYLRNIYFRAFPSRKPPCFDACWDFPDVPVDRCTDLLDPALPGSLSFLIYPMSDWHARIQRSQFFAKTLAAQGHRCFLLNPHLGREFPGMNGEPPRLARLAENIYELHIRLPDEPVYHHRNLRESESETLAGAVSQLIDAGHLTNVMQLVSFPVWSGVARRVKERFRAPIIYDCHDQLDGFAGVAPEIVGEEPALMAASDLVICSADRLRGHCIALGVSPDRCHVVRNAVSGQSVTVAARVLPKQAASPVIGYMGALEDWFDCEAIRVAAQARPHWRFVLAGRSESRKLRSLLHLSNVTFVGEVSRDQVPGILAGFDIATIPFALNPLTLGADPIKLYEYLAAGLPVVSSRLPETERFSNFVHYYDDPQSFIGAVQVALEDSEEARRLQRQSAVKDETWESRCDQILNLLHAI